MFCADINNNLLRFIFEFIFPEQFFGDCLFQLDGSRSRGIFCFASVKGGDGGIFDVLRGVEIRFACAKTDDVDALSFELFRPCGNSQRG